MTPYSKCCNNSNFSVNINFNGGQLDMRIAVIILVFSSIRDMWIWKQAYIHVGHLHRSTETVHDLSRLFSLEIECCPEFFWPFQTVLEILLPCQLRAKVLRGFASFTSKDIKRSLKTLCKNQAQWCDISFMSTSIRKGSQLQGLLFTKHSHLL